MARKILPGELFIVLYKDGGGVNQWAVNSGKTAIVLNDGHLVKEGVIDVLHESLDPAVQFTANRGNLKVSDADASKITMLKDAGFRKQIFGNQELQVLKVLNQTDIFNSSGTKIGTVPAGTEIGVQDGTAGNSMKHLLAINAYDSKDGNGWRFTNQTAYTHGFINIQQAFGLKMYNSRRAIETAYSVTENNVNWAHVEQAQSGKKAQKEAYLRNIPVAATKETIVLNVNDYFASVDLAGEVIGDPEQYFGIAKNAEFIIRSMKELNLSTTAFEAERSFFLSK